MAQSHLTPLPVLSIFGRSGTTLLKWLGVRLDPADVEAQSARFTHHMTSSTPSESVGRWRQEMPADLKDFFLQELGDELKHFGYRD